MRILNLLFCFSICGGMALAQETEKATEKPNSLQRHLEKYPNSGWSCILRKKQYRAELPSDEAKCRRLGGKFSFAKDLKRDAPNLDQIESPETKSERQHRLLNPAYGSEDI